MTDMNENEEIVEAVAEKAEATEAPVEKPKAGKQKAAVEVEAPAEAPAEAVASPAVEAEAPRADADVVYLSRCIFKNRFSKKSFTVHLLQRRLKELGFNDAYGDRDGWYGDLTAKSVREYQESRGLNATGMMDAETFSSIFAGDRSVVVNLVD